jgi:hypothetical protein
MTFKIRRTDETASFNVTADWLRDFTNDMYRNLKPIMQYSSIDEKMSDIKRRVGFGLVQPDEISIVAEEDCGCGGSDEESCACDVKTASDHDVEKMKNILLYIKDMASHESHLAPTSIIQKCREEDGLGFEDLKIDMEKLKDFIQSELSKHQNETKEEVRYIPSEPEMGDNFEDSEADYYRHGNNFNN